MKPGEGDVQEIDDLLADAEGLPHWLGFSSSHGWLLLDRAEPDNAPGTGDTALLRFVRLGKTDTVSLTRSEWNDGISVSFYKSNHGKLDTAEALRLLREWRRLRGYWFAPRTWKQVRTLLGVRRTSAVRGAPAVKRDDVALCLTWANVAHTATSTATVLLESLVNHDRHQASRLLSARQAELVAAAYYGDLGRPVRDVSVKQLVEGQGGDWVDFDFDVGYPVDVKNARATINGGAHFAEHAVAKFKQERLSLLQVRVVGVRSTYFADAREVAGGGPGAETTVLGEASASDLRALQSWMQERYGRVLSVDELWTPKRLPGWVFEYPDDHYPKRDEAVDLLISLTATDGTEFLRPGLWLIASAMGRAPEGTFPHSPLVADLAQVLSRCGLSKRSVIAVAIGTVLEAALRQYDTRDVIQQIRVAISLTDEPSDDPLGLDDPLGYVGRFLTTLGLLGKGLQPFAGRIRRFYLRGPDLLEAELDDERRWTMVAYCGGWLPQKGRCGSAPLVVGQHENCRQCRRLVCSDCGFCHDSCSLMPSRQTTVRESPYRWRAYSAEAEDPDLASELEDFHASEPTHWQSSNDAVDEGYWDSLIRRHEADRL